MRFDPKNFGLAAGLVALPLAMAFAISSGVTSQAGLYGSSPYQQRIKQMKKMTILIAGLSLVIGSRCHVHGR